MSDCLKAGVSTAFVVHHPSNQTEQDLVSRAEMAEEDLRNRKVRFAERERECLLHCPVFTTRCYVFSSSQTLTMRSQLYGHLHNLRDKVQPGMFSEFKASVVSNLTLSRRQLVEKSKSFKEFSSTYQVLPDSFKDSIKAAAGPFMEQYGKLTPEFWLQYSAVESLNTDRNKKQHCTVAESAAAFTVEALLNLPEDFQDALAMVEALAQFGRKHAAELDKQAAEQHKMLAKVTAKLKTKLLALKLS